MLHSTDYGATRGNPGDRNPLGYAVAANGLLREGVFGNLGTEVVLAFTR